MSPNEAQLRAALREGEGERPDAATIIARAERLRGDRRQRFRTVAGGLAAAAVVGGLGFGISRLNGSEDAGSSSAVADRGSRYHAASSAAAGSAAGAGGAGRAAGGAAVHNTAQASGSQASRSQAPGAQAGALGSSTGAACPTSPVHYLLPGGGSPGQFGSDGPLFTRRMHDITVCAVSPDGNVSRVGTLTVHASRAVAAALQAGSTSPDVQKCMMVRDPRAVDLVPRDDRGRRLRTVVITPRCTTVQATNGTAIRYVRLDQRALAQIALALQRRERIPGPPPPRPSG